MENYELNVDQIFSSNMVLPAGKSFKIAGVGVSGKTVKVDLDGTIKRTVINRRGEWSVRFSPIIDTSRAFEVNIQDGIQHLTLENVRFGRVILVAGQSNIGFRMAHDQDFKSEKENFKGQNIFYYNAPQPSFIYQNGKVNVYQSKETHWHQLKASNLEHMSAIAYYAAQKLVEEDPGIPVGVVCCTRDGTFASTWISESTLKENQQLLEEVVLPFEDRLKAATDADFESEIKDYRDRVHRHNRRMYNFMKDNPTVSLGMAISVVGQAPWPPPVTPDSYLRPGSLFKAMILKIKNYTFNQAVWYQGESNVKNYGIYDQLLFSLINDWRDAFQDYSLPFYVMQLPKYADVPRNSWAKIRNQQLKVTQVLDSVHLVSIADTGEVYNPHPVAKRDVGRRLGRILAGNGYSDTPILEEVTRNDGDTIFKFKFVNQIQTRQGCFIEGLVNHHWQAVPGEINQNTIRIQFPKGTTEARYGYSNAPILTLFNEQGDPVAPFLVDLTSGKLI